MGFLSNLKSNLTGDWATVSLQVPPGRPGQTLPVSVAVAVKDKPIEVDGVVVKVRCAEIVDIPGYRSANSSDGLVNVQTNEELFSHVVRLAGPQQLEAGAQSTFTGELQLPGHLPPAFHGRNARVQWWVQAALEMKGNDPDSGWQELPVSA